MTVWEFESALKLHTILLPLSKQEGVLWKRMARFLCFMSLNTNKVKLHTIIQYMLLFHAYSHCSRKFELGQWPCYKNRKGN